jgi:hypothetical protein
LAAISAFARSLVRINRARRFSADDYLILFALASLVSTGVLYSLNIDFLFELHSILDADGLPSSSFDQDLQFFLRCQFTVVMLFWTTLWAVKFAILMYYKPLFDGLSGRWLWFWWGVFAFTLLSYMGATRASRTRKAGAMQLTGDRRLLGNADAVMSSDCQLFHCLMLDSPRKLGPDLQPLLCYFG